MPTPARFLCLWTVLLSLVQLRVDGELTRLNCHVSSVSLNDADFALNTTSLCTHLTYDFIQIDNDELYLSDSYNDKRAFEAMQRIKKSSEKPPHLLFDVPGPDFTNQGSKDMSRICKSPGTRAKFIKSIMKFLEQHKFDGVVIDWQYPGADPKSGGSKEDAANFPIFLKELRTKLDLVGYVLGVQVAASSSVAFRDSYNVKEVSETVDFVDMMTYSYYGSWATEAAHHSALAVNEQGHKSDYHILTVTNGIDYWLKNGASPSKLNLGIASFGWMQTLANGSDPTPFAPTNGGQYMGDAVVRTCQDGFRIERFEGWSSPVAIKYNSWISFEDVTSVKEKVKFSKSKGLGGIMYNGIDFDDNQGTCEMGTSPLLRAISEDIRIESRRLVKSGKTFEEIYSEPGMVTTVNEEASAANELFGVPTYLVILFAGASILGLIFFVVLLISML